MNYLASLMIIAFVYLQCLLMAIGLSAALHKLRRLTTRSACVIAGVVALDLISLVAVFIRRPATPEVIMVIAVVQLACLAGYTYGVMRGWA